MPVPDADDRTLRSFAGVMLVALALCSVKLLRRHASLALAAAPVAVGVSLVLVSLVAPRALRGIYRAWMALGEALGAITTPVILTAVFVGVLVPTRLLLALLRSDPLARRLDRGAKSYWTERDRKGFDREGFERLW